MPLPLPIEHFLPRVLQKQSALNAKIRKPLIDSRAILLLSCHVDSVFDGEEEAMIMNFFGAFWVFAPQTGIIGFFSTEVEAVQYARSCIAETRDTEDA